MFSPFSLLVITLTFTLAGIVKGVTGMGLPTVAMGVLAVYMPPLSAASLLLVPSLVTNIWQLAAGPGFFNLILRLWPMMVGIVMGTAAGARALTQSGTGWTAAALGAALTVYAVASLLLRPLSVSRRAERWLSPAIGFATGVVAGGTGVFVIPAVPYLQALGLAREDLIQGLGLSFTVSTLALTVMLADSIPPGHVAASALAVIPALLGMWLGSFIRRRISPETFRRIFLYGLAVLGLDLIAQSILR